MTDFVHQPGCPSPWMCLCYPVNPVPAGRITLVFHGGRNWEGEGDDAGWHYWPNEEVACDTPLAVVEALRDRDEPAWYRLADGPLVAWR